MNSLLSSLDILGPAYNITFQRENSLKTRVGSVLSLVFFGILTASIVMFARDYADTSKPTITSTEISLNPNYRFNLAENSMLPIFFIQDYTLSGKLTPKQVLTKFSFLLVSSIVAVDDKDPKKTQFKDTIRHGVPCSSLEKEGFYNYPALASNYAAIKEKVDEFGICIGIQDPANLFISGFGGDVGDRRAMIRVGPCFGRSDCENVNYFNLEIRVVFPQFSTLLYNHDKPYDVKINLEDFTRLFAWRGYTTHTIKSQLRAVTQPPRIIGEEVEIARYPQTSESKDFFSRYSTTTNWIIKTCMDNGEMHYESCQGFVKYDYRFIPVMTRYTRSYSRLTDLFSNIGGFASILFQIFSYINLAFLFFAKNSIMIQRAFPLLRYLDKNLGAKYSKSIEQAADDLLNRSFDVTNIFQELCCIRLISKVLLSEDQQKTASLYPLYELHMEQCKQSEANEEAKKRGEKLKKSFSHNKKILEIFKDLFKRLKQDGNKKLLLTTMSINEVRAVRGSIATIRVQADKVLQRSIDGLGVLIPSEPVHVNLEVSNSEENNLDLGIQIDEVRKAEMGEEDLQQRDLQAKENPLDGHLGELNKPEEAHFIIAIPKSPTKKTPI